MSGLGRDFGPPRVDHVRKPVGWYLAWVGSCAFGFFGVWYAFQVGLGYDSHAYWLAVQDMGRLYGAPALARDAFLYSPAFAQLIWPLGLLPWPAFYVLWTLLSAVIFVWLLRPLGRTWFAPAFIATLPEIVTGNIYALMAAALVLGVSSGPPWVFLGLTKIAGGGVGLVWLTLTRQWRALVVGLVTAMAVVGLSVAISLDQWRDWISVIFCFLRVNADGESISRRSSHVWSCWEPVLPPSSSEVRPAEHGCCPCAAISRQPDRSRN